MNKSIESILEGNNTNKIEELKELSNQGEVLSLLYKMKEYEIFRGILNERTKEEIENYQEMIIINICSYPINDNELEKFFELLMNKEIENEIIIRNIQIGSYKNKKGKEQHIQILKIFHRSYNNYLNKSQLFHLHFNELNSIITTPPKPGFSQLQSYPTVTVKGTCLICKNSLFDGQPVTIYPCGHGIHSACSDYINDTSLVCRYCVALSSSPLI
ncbi:hypothetical protein ENUP19_0341G0078 [Entamoeba nuttalli]|uniref:RING-type domain-containing protein n=1 Tax=Entamoeba nuttalli TaxID=412467 RepID=A0ABQ0DXG9_9EUKA